jgi:hypothetical protein
VLRVKKPQAKSLYRKGGQAGVGARGVNLARSPVGALARPDRVAYPVGPGDPAGTRDDQEQLVPGSRVGPDGPAWLQGQTGDGHGTVAGSDAGGMQPDAAVRAYRPLIAVETENLNA